MRVPLFVAVLACVSCGSSSSESPPPATDTGSDAADTASESASDASTGKANGTVGTWTTLGALPEPRANHCAAVVSGFVVVIGGNRKEGAGFVKSDAILAAKLLDAGALAEWKQVGTMPSAVTECTATANAGTLFVSDGIFDVDTDGKQVLTASLSEAGVLTKPSVRAALPSTRRTLSSSAWYARDQLFAMSVKLPTDGDLVGTLRMTNGDAPTFAQEDWLPGFRGRPQYAFTGSFVYVLGGYFGADKGNVTTDDVQGAPIDASGKIGSPFATQKLPEPTTFGQAIAVDDYVFVLGGRDAALGGTPRAEVYSAKIGADGKLSAWTKQASLPAPRTNFQVSLGGDFLFVTGGGADGPGLDTVFAARVRF